MTGAARLWLGLGGAGLAVAAALSVQGLRADSAATVANLPPPCSSCDARHARLRDRQTTAVEVEP